MRTFQLCEQRAIAAVRRTLLSSVILLCGCGLTRGGRILAERSSDPDLTFEHMRLDVRLTHEDIAARRLPGVVSFRIRVSEDAPHGIHAISLNAAELSVSSVEMLPERRPLEYEHADDQLRIQLGRTVRAGDEFTLRIAYTAKPHKEALYFNLPDEDQDGTFPTIYTMGEPMRTRYWLPCRDRPDTRWSSDIYVSVPEPLVAVSVGIPIGEPGVTNDGLRTYHWRQTKPIDPHLLGFAIGKYVVVKDEWRGRPVLAYVYPGDEDKARFTFRRVPEMLSYYSDLLGVDFPYPQFAHVEVRDHFHGGMEHAGFDMIAPRLMTTGAKGEAPLERSQFNYVAHMIAHAWFAGMVNYRDISQAWINEGFATYLHENWRVRAQSHDRFITAMWRRAQLVARFDKPGSGKPMVRTDLSNPEEIYRFDAGKVYLKGAWVLHMLRHQLGEETFWKATRRFLTQHAGGSAVTGDLRQAFERESGRDLREFFGRWVLGVGVPHLEISYRWDAAARRARVTVRQTQTIDAENPPFKVPLDLWFRVGGAAVVRSVDLTASQDEFEFELAGAPDVFCVDPDCALLAMRKVSKPDEMWRRQSMDGPTQFARDRAAEAVGASDNDE